MSQIKLCKYFLSSGEVDLGKVVPGFSIGPSLGRLLPGCGDVFVLWLEDSAGTAVNARCVQRCEQNGHGIVTPAGHALVDNLVKCRSVEVQDARL